MTTTAVVGINWGDEGKGRMVDLLSQDYDVIVRFQGGSNAGHTVVNEYGKFALNLIPSGIFTPGTVNVLATGTVVDIEHLAQEIIKVTTRAKGIEITPANFKISQRAIICFPFHRELDGLEEDRLADKKYGSTRRGVAPVYGDKYLKKGVQIGELLYPEYLKDRMDGVLEWANLRLAIYGAKPYEKTQIMDWLLQYGDAVKDYICDTSAYLQDAIRDGKDVLFEAQLGAIRDLDYGIYPYSSSSSPLTDYVPIGAGIPGLKLDKVVGIVKAYSTSIGEGPFVVNLEDEVGIRLREIGAEYGAATGRPRNVGYFDLVATKYGVYVQRPTEIALTKLDTLSQEEVLKICVGYEIQGQVHTDFPFTPLLYQAKPVYIEMPGWGENISHIRDYNKLPVNARKYVDFIEENIETPIRYISVGPERNEYIVKL
ncbi:MAG: adenylosuccinate synthase [Deltaproteobacteria bacterium]